MCDNPALGSRPECSRMCAVYILGILTPGIPAKGLSPQLICHPSHVSFQSVGLPPHHPTHPHHHFLAINNSFGSAFLICFLFPFLTVQMCARTFHVHLSDRLFFQVRLDIPDRDRQLLVLLVSRLIIIGGSRGKKKKNEGG